MEIENDKIDAKWARETATGVLGEKVKKQLDTILTGIKKAATNNERKYTPSLYMDDLTRQELSKRGFMLEFYPGDPRDSRDVDYYVISW